MPHTSEQVRVLILAGSEAAAPSQVMDSLRDKAEIVLARTPDQAAALLRAGSFDLILGLPQQMQALVQAADAGQILRELGQPACIVDRAGGLVWGNRQFHAYPEDVTAGLATACAERFVASREGKPRRKPVEVGQYSFDLTVAPLLDADGSLDQIVGLAWDISARTRLQVRLNAIDTAGRELVSLDADALAEMDVPARLALLEERIVSSCRDLLHFDHFAILLVDEKSKRLETLIASGMTEAEGLGMIAAREGNGIAGYVAATATSYVSRDVRKDSRYLPGLEDARSCLTVPISLHDRVIGVLNVESERIGAFTAEDVQYAEIFARYLALSLHMLQLLVVERRTTTGQIAAEVDAEAATPLNAIITGVASIIDDYAAADPALRDRLQQVIADVDRVKDAIHAATEPAPISGTLGAGEQRDAFLRGASILVADDEDIIRETIAEVLSGVGGNVTMAADGEEAVQLVKARPFDLVLSDIKMPNRNGYEVFAAAREQDANCPVILITGFGYDPDHNVVRASREGLAGVLFKPFKVDQLLDQIRAAVSSYSPGR